MISAAEQLLIELINRARLDPQAEADRYLGGDLNQGIGAGTLTNFTRQPLAGNDALNRAADAHSQHMLNVNMFEHTGIGDGTPGSRATGQGYGTNQVSENISARFENPTIDLNAAILENHRGLFQSPTGHRQNMLNNNDREVGVGQQGGPYFFQGQTWQTSMVTEKFSSFSNDIFLTGVFYNDTNNDNFYSIGEAVGNQTVTMGAMNAVTAAAGGYQIDVGNTTGFQNVMYANVNVNLEFTGQNVKFDIVDGASVYTSTNINIVSGVNMVQLLGLNNLAINGGAGNEILNGNSGNNYINGGVGTDLMTGGAGNDTYTIDNLNDVIVEQAGGGDDAVYSFNDAALSGNIETLILAPTAQNAISGFGDGNVNQIFGNEFNNVIYGRGNVDRLGGGAGDDIFVMAMGDQAANLQEQITDFEGAGVAGGDRMGLSGFGPGATVVQVSTNSYEVRDAGNVAQASFILEGVTTALTADDYYFT